MLLITVVEIELLRRDEQSPISYATDILFDWFFVK